MVAVDDKPDPAAAGTVLNTARPEPSIEHSFALLSSALPAEQPAAPAAPAASAAAPIDAALLQQFKLVEAACRDPLNRLIEELELCRRYYEATFPKSPIDRLVFIGGEAKQKSLCQQIARRMALSAQVGDPMVRLNKHSEVGIDSGIDRREPQPCWAIAIGLSMGPTASTAGTAPAKAEAVRM
jgi:Tfp pilus assembly PilM family ATPase